MDGGPVGGWGISGAGRSEGQGAVFGRALYNGLKGHFFGLKMHFLPERALFWTEMAHLLTKRGLLWKKPLFGLKKGTLLD